MMEDKYIWIVVGAVAAELAHYYLFWLTSAFPWLKDFHSSKNLPYREHQSDTNMIY